MVALMTTLGSGASADTPKLDTQGRLCVGGVPIFPVGLYGVPVAEMTRVPRESFNTIVDPYWAQGPRSTPAHLAAARANGFYLIVGVPYEKTRAQDTVFLEDYIRDSHGILLSDVDAENQL